MSQEKLQLQSDIRELELTAEEYPPDSAIRYFFFGVAAAARKDFSLSEGEKLEIVDAELRKFGRPCTRGELVERLDFTREESRRLVSVAIESGIVDTFTESTSGRPVKMLKTP